MNATTPDQEQTAEPRSTILIVDDDPKHLVFLGDRLTAEGYSVITAGSAEEARRVIGQRRPNLVLLDIMMPEMSGMELLPVIKKPHPEIPVVMVTAVWDEEEGRKAFDLKAFDYITKPVNFDYLKTSILTALSL